MEPQYSVFIFSKYSPNCKKIFEIIGNSGIDMDKTIGDKLQLLCVDNEQIRKRIRENQQIDVVSVPCILSIFPNGGVEKYDGTHAFTWVENLIMRYMPPPPTPAPAPLPLQRMEPELEPEPESESESVRHKSKPKRVKIPNRMKPIEHSTATSIDDIPLAEDDSDRHRNLPQPKRIRRDESEYLEDNELFSGEIPDNRRESRNIVRSSASASDRRNNSDPNGLRAKAEALARGRDDIDRQFSNPTGRPVGDRRP